jgi:sugar/nucleoside kinase (ribokinase family)
VTLSVEAWPAAAQVLGQVSAAVISIVDVNGDWAVAEGWARAVPVLAVTEGAAGCTVFTRAHGARQFRAPPAAEVDPTGAGDIFAAAFFVHLYETGDAWGAARLANEVAALSVSRAGLAGVPGREEVGLCRARAEQSGALRR